MRLKHPSLFVVLAFCAPALWGCQYAGPDNDNPIARNLTWFSYVGGEDIRKFCTPGASDEYRFVYNGVYEKQVRTYDIRVLPDGRSAAMSAWARGEGNLAQTRPIFQIGRIWSGDRAKASIPLGGLTELRSALKEDAFRSDRPAVLRLPSNDFYWTAVACVDGRFVANAWLYPSGRFKILKFPAVLAKYDGTGVPFRTARPVDQRDDDPTHYDRGESGKHFILQLGPNGFVGTNAPF